jgi:hypothetical protein
LVKRGGALLGRLARAPAARDVRGREQESGGQVNRVVSEYSQADERRSLVLRDFTKRVSDTGCGPLAVFWSQRVRGLSGQYGVFMSAQALAKLLDEVGVLVLWVAEISLRQRVDGSHQRHGFGN